VLTRRHGIERLRWWVGFGITFWAANLPPFTALFFILDFETFVKVSALYIADISIVALSLGCGSWYQSLRVEQHQQDDADVQEVLDVVTAQEADE
jgi:hypothetical protein